MGSIYLITLTVGIIVFIISVFLFRQTLYIMNKGTRTKATVIDIEKIADSDETTYTPVFKFKTTTHQEIVFKYHLSGTHALFDIGEEVFVVYNPENPGQAKVLTYFGSFMWTIVLMAISMPLIVVGGGYFFTKQYLK
jgi:hypothetical protein